MACKGIPGWKSGPRLGPDRMGCGHAIHGRFGARVALLQSPIPKTAGAIYQPISGKKSSEGVEKSWSWVMTIGVEID